MKELLEYLMEFWNATHKQTSVIAQHVESMGKGFLRGTRIYLKTLIRLALAAFFLPLPVLIAGIALNTGWLISTAGILWSLAVLAILFTTAPLGILLEVLLKGRKGSGRRYLKMATSILLVELTFTLFIAVVPLWNNWNAVPVVILTSAILGVLAAQGMRTIFTKRLLRVATTATFLVFFASFAFPRSFITLQDLCLLADEQFSVSILPGKQRAAMLPRDRADDATWRGELSPETAFRFAQAYRHAESREGTGAEMQQMGHDQRRLHGAVTPPSQKTEGVTVSNEIREIARRYHQAVTLRTSAR